MTIPTQKIGLTIHLNESQLGYLAYRFPELDPEDAIVQLLEYDRIRTLRKADRKVEVLDLQGDPQPVEPEPDIPVPVASENPIGDLQEYCQQKQVPMPSYDFEAVDNGFCCTVNALGLSASATASSKKAAKAEAAGLLVELLGQARVYVVECNRSSFSLFTRQPV
jgi:Double-stranded RNA binding motif